MSEISTNNKRIAKNTLLLYFRMMLLMLVSLYTSRVNLNALGVDNFGIFAVVGGLVSMFHIVSSALTGSINRFLTFELGREDYSRLKRVFATACGIQYFLVLIVAILAETIGLWFLNNKMVIPPDRIYAANWVYQLSVLSFCLDLLTIPYTSAIIAREKMSAFAYISILQAVGKLLIAYLIMISPIDRLIWFAALLLVNSTIIRFIYIIYCKRHFEECRTSISFDPEMRREMFGFAGWNFIGTIAAIMRDYGGNIVINLFFGPAVNAARGIAGQVNGAVSSFVDNFQTALKPQITKSYASGNYDYMFDLIFQGARLSYYILLILVMPIIFNVHYILLLWLGQVPEHTEIFVILILIFSLSESLANPLITAMLATGNIKKFQIVVGGLNLLNVPMSYMILRLGGAPEFVIVVAIVISIMCEISRAILLRKLINLSVRQFIQKVYINVISVTLVALVAPLFVSREMNETFLSFILISIVSVVSTLLSILYVGCNNKERLYVYMKAKYVINKWKRIKK